MCVERVCKSVMKHGGTQAAISQVSSEMHGRDIGRSVSAEQRGGHVLRKVLVEHMHSSHTSPSALSPSPKQTCTSRHVTFLLAPEQILFYKIWKGNGKIKTAWTDLVYLHHIACGA